MQQTSARAQVSPYTTSPRSSQLGTRLSSCMETPTQAHRPLDPSAKTQSASLVCLSQISTSLPSPTPTPPSSRPVLQAYSGSASPLSGVWVPRLPHGQTLTRRSLLWRQLLQAELNKQPPSKRDLALPFASRRIPFPDFEFLHGHAKRQSGNFTSSSQAIASMSNYGPLLTRLIAQGMLESPMFSITLQRDTVDIGGDVGLLSIGQLSPGIPTNSLTWVPLRAYPAKQGGLPPPPESPNEVRRRIRSP